MPHKRTVIEIALATFLVALPIVAAESEIGHSFDSPDTVWQLLDNGVPARLLQQDHQHGGARDNGGCERMVVAAPVGQSGLVGCAIQRVAVLDELEVRMWVKASRPDVQLAARVVMPRSVAPDGHGLAAAIVRGQRYEQASQWQQLIVRDVPKLLATEVRAMRAVPGAKVDSREAYVDAIVLVVPGDTQGVEILTDDLSVDGILLPRGNEVQLTGFPNADAATHGNSVSSALATSPSAARHSLTQLAQSPVQLRGSLLLVDGRPFAPRAIQWNGEPLGFLTGLGFNTVLLESPPADELILNAERHNLWIICVPPRPDAIASQGLGRSDDRVIAWYLNDEIIETDPQYARNWADLVRQHDAQIRPILLAPEAGWQSSDNTADIMAARHVRASMLPTSQYEEWLRSRASFIRPDTALWASLPTQFGAQVAEQSAALDGSLPEYVSVEEDQLEDLQHVAWTSGCRGVVFQSYSSLNDATNSARRRAVVLELANRRLHFIEPWMASGKIAGQLTSSDGKWIATLLQAEGARLLVPIAERSAIAGNAVATHGQTSAVEIAFVVPGVAESAKAFFISPVSFRQLTIERVAGGTRVNIPHQPGGMVLIAEDPRVIQAVRQRVARSTARVVSLELQLAELRLKSIEEVEIQLSEAGITNEISKHQIAAWKQELHTCSGLLAASRLEPAYDHIAAINTTLSDAAKLQQGRLSNNQPLISNPLSLNHNQLPSNAKLLQSINRFGDSENRLDGGDFEDVAQLMQSGWQHVAHPSPGIEAVARISAVAPLHGNYCLELVATSSNNLTTLTTAPVWINSPPVPIEPGDVAEISGWVRVDEPIAGSVDGLQIVDSLGGGELALAVRKTTGWQPFHMIRAVSQTTELRITFALAGLGTARIDGVMVRILKTPSVRRLPAVTSNIDEVGTVVASERGPLLTAPAQQ